MKRQLGEGRGQDTVLLGFSRVPPAPAGRLLLLLLLLLLALLRRARLGDGGGGGSLLILRRPRGRPRLVGFDGRLGSLRLRSLRSLRGLRLRSLRSLRGLRLRGLRLHEHVRRHDDEVGARPKDSRLGRVPLVRRARQRHRAQSRAPPVELRRPSRDRLGLAHQEVRALDPHAVPEVHQVRKHREALPGADAIAHDGPHARQVPRRQPIHARALVCAKHAPRHGLSRGGVRGHLRGYAGRERRGRLRR